MSSRKRAPSPGFLVDTHGHVFKRYKSGDKSFYFIADVLESSSNVVPGSFSNERLQARQAAQAVLDNAVSQKAKPKTSKATSTSTLRDTSPPPSDDARIPDWVDETRPFEGKIVFPKTAKGEARRLARDAQKSPLWVMGLPQFNLFVNGSYGKVKGKGYGTDGRKPKKEKNGNQADRKWKSGGYSVVFRNPYHKHEKGPAELNHNHNGEIRNHSMIEDGLRHSDFNIRHWSSKRVLSREHVELAALAQALETVSTVVKTHRPPLSSVTVFTDNVFSLGLFEGNGKAGALLPLVRVIIWQSRFLANLGCKVKLQWLPNNCVLAHKLAKSAAACWCDQGTVFHQIDRPLSQRDAIIDKVHGDVAQALDKIHAKKTEDSSVPPVWEPCLLGVKDLWQIRPDAPPELPQYKKDSIFLHI